MNYRLLIFGISLVIFIFIFLKIYSKNKTNDSHRFSIRQIARIGVFGALSAILYIFVKFPIPLFPSFLEFHFDEIPVFIASFAYGPISGLFVLLLKTIIKLPFSTTLCVGELADLLYSVVFVIPASLIYRKRRNFKSVIIGLSVGFVLQLIVSLLGNIYVMVPFYMNIMGFSEEALIELCQLANSSIKDLKWTYGLIAVLPFNIIKNSLVIILTLISYKSVHKFIDKIHN